jgi:cation diffusion facilitator CzcD-associated flavoprotein CzcO
VNTDAFRGTLLEGPAWRGHDFSGQRVAVIANGREAASIVPSVVRTASAVKVFQVEPTWVLPRLPRGARAVARVADRLAGSNRKLYERVARLHLFASVRDPWTRRLLTPSSRFERPSFAESSSYYAALQEPHCKLVHWPVYAIVELGVRTAEGIEHRVDSIVLPDPAVLCRRRAEEPPMQEELGA